MQLELLHPDRGPVSPLAFLEALDQACAPLVVFQLSDTISAFQRRWARLLGTVDTVLRPVILDRRDCEARRAAASTKERRLLGRRINEIALLQSIARGRVEHAWSQAYVAFTANVLAPLSASSQSWLHEVLCHPHAHRQFGGHTIARLIDEAAADDAAEEATPSGN